MYMSSDDPIISGRQVTIDQAKSLGKFAKVRLSKDNERDKTNQDEINIGKSHNNNQQQDTEIQMEKKQKNKENGGDSSSKCTPSKSKRILLQKSRGATGDREDVLK